MEVNNIVFTGIGRAVSDIDSHDGELSVSHNLILDNGAMRPIWVPGNTFELNEGESLVYIHRGTTYKNYIIRKDGVLYFATDESPLFREEVATLREPDLDITLTSVGNTLVLTTGKGIEYILFKENAYKYLGSKPDETVINFRLYSYLFEQASDGYVINHDDIIVTNNDASATRYEIKEEAKDLLSDREGALVNKLVADAIEQNKIVYPCFVRYAYRLYDGSLMMHSSPVLLVPNTGVAPVVTYPYKEGTNGQLQATSFASDIIFDIKEDVLGDWKDVVSSIDIYMSEPISTRNHDVKITFSEQLSGSDAAKSLNYGYGVAEFGKYGPVTFLDAFNSKYASTVEEYTTFSLYGEGMKRTDLNDVVKRTGNFYKVRSIDVNEIPSNEELLFGDPETSQYSLGSLVTGERMVDDYRTHDNIIPDFVFPYNQRLNISGIKRVMFNGYDTTAMVADVLDENEDEVYYTIFTHIKKDNREIVVQNTCSGLDSFYPMYLYYPDPDAYKMTIVQGLPPFDSSGLYEGYVVNLEEHPSLNGSVFFNGFKLPEETVNRRFSLPEVTSSDVLERNKIYTSEVNNPFHFPLAGINTIGTGDVIGISSVTKALSQGQFGQFPLYVFSTDGIWAMEVGNDGLYSSVKPVSRDVCVNGKSITQTDNAVMFVTEKGVMMLDGSNVMCISEMMNGRSFDVSEVDKLNTVMNNAGVPSALQGVQDFMDYARVARMAYDYANNRIVLYKDGESFCYVYSMGSTTWATLGLSIDHAVTDYPNVYIQSGVGVKNLSTRIDYDGAAKVNTMLVSRPIKLGDDGFKTMYELVARGAMDRREGAVLLWGSHDGQRYVLIKAVKGNRIYRTGGSGYRYFRIGVVGSMKVGETLTMASVGFRRKYGNRLR